MSTKNDVYNQSLELFQGDIDKMDVEGHPSEGGQFAVLTRGSTEEISTGATRNPSVKPNLASSESDAKTTHTVAAARTAVRVLEMLFDQEDDGTVPPEPNLAMADSDAKTTNTVAAARTAARVLEMVLDQEDDAATGNESLAGRVDSKVFSNVSRGDGMGQSADASSSVPGDSAKPTEHALEYATLDFDPAVGVKQTVQEDILSMVDASESVITSPPSQVPLRPNPNVRPLSHPGAFAVAGINGIDASGLNDGLSVHSDNFDIESNTTTSQQEHGNLAVAERVTETDHDLQRAEEFDKEGAGAQSESKLRRQKRFYQQAGLGAVLVAVVLVSVLVALLVPGEKGSIQSSQETNTTAPTTTAPTPAPTLSRADYLLSFLPQATAGAILRQKGKPKKQWNPQKKSFEWLLEDPSVQNYTVERIVQRFALATFYFSTTRPNQAWLLEDDWLSYDVHECEWYHYYTHSFYEIPESETNLLYNVTNATAPCNEAGSYEHLWQAHNELVGTLPDELYLLTSLKSLSLDRNDNLQGTLSSQIGLLTNLEALALFNNMMTGSLPSEIGLLTHLQFLWVMRNQWTGSIPTELGLLSSLVYLVGDSCHFSGPLPTEVGKLTNLKWLWLWRNEFTGALPSELGVMENVTSVAIDFNNFTGTIPTEVGLMTNMDTLHIEHNFLSGTFPSELVLLTKLNSFVCCSTFITGTIPSELGLLANFTKRLWAWDNLLTGILPTELGMLSKLASLEFSDNSLTGTIPSELGNLRFAWMMRLQNNHFTGTLPTEVGLLQGMSTFWVNGNLLTGPIPSELGAMDSMLEYWDDALNETVEFSPLVDLQLDNCVFTGEVPSELGLLTSLTHLFINNNSELTWKVPDIFCELGDLKEPDEEPMVFRIDCGLVECNCSICTCG